MVWCGKPGAAARVIARGAAEVAVGDLGDRASIVRALDGVTSIFYIAPVSLPHEAEVGQALVVTAIAAGVRRLVFSSVIHPVLSGMSNHAMKAPVEEAILDSDLEYSFLHPTLFFQNFAGSWATIVETGVLAEPWSTDTRFSRVDYRDVAEVAAIALTEDRSTARSSSAPRAPWTATASRLWRARCSAVGSRRSGSTPLGLGTEVAPLRPMFDHYDRRGLRCNALTLRAILGREPRTLRAYFEGLAGYAGEDH